MHFVLCDWCCDVFIIWPQFIVTMHSVNAVCLLGETILNGLVSWEASIGLFSFGIPLSMGNDLRLVWTAAISVLSDWVFCTVDRDIRHFSMDSPCLCFNAVTFYSALSQFLAMILYWTYMNKIVKIILARFIVGGLIHFLTCHPHPRHYGKVWSPWLWLQCLCILVFEFSVVMDIHFAGMLGLGWWMYLVLVSSLYWSKWSNLCCQNCSRGLFRSWANNRIRRSSNQWVMKLCFPVIPIMFASNYSVLRT